MRTQPVEYTTRSPEETEHLATRFVERLQDGTTKRGTSTIIALQGNLGAGKTVFVKGAAHALGVEETVTSPTFVIEKVYRLPEGAAWKHLIHIDAYKGEFSNQRRLPFIYAPEASIFRF